MNWDKLPRAVGEGAVARKASSCPPLMVYVMCDVQEFDGKRDKEAEHAPKIGHIRRTLKYIEQSLTGFQAFVLAVQVHEEKNASSRNSDNRKH